MISKRILLIDDEPDIHKIAEIGLMLESGWQMFTATSGKAGITLAASQQPDAILLDVMMPDMDGLATLESLQHNRQTQAIPVIFLTAKAQSADRRRLYSAGAKGVITKPFDPTTLASQIAGYLGWPL
ncbi:MAG: response regulator [Leptolyngbya sp. SIO4C5]|nr:response regulator [Leptolyngbya sp. SIO4C5]